MPVDSAPIVNVEPSKPQGSSGSAGIYVARYIGKADTVPEERRRSPQSKLGEKAEI